MVGDMHKKYSNINVKLKRRAGWMPELNFAYFILDVSLGLAESYSVVFPSRDN